MILKKFFYILCSVLLLIDGFDTSSLFAFVVVVTWRDPKIKISNVLMSLQVNIISIFMYTLSINLNTHA